MKVVAIRCPKCGRSYDVVKFESGESISCPCGQTIDLLMLETVEDFLRYFQSQEEIEKAKEIQRDAQWICQMILNPHCADIDIEIAKEKLRQKVAGLFPDKMETYRMIYEARFKRLEEQFRSSESAPPGDDPDNR